MTKRAKEHDFAVVARRVVEKAIGEQFDGSPLPDPLAGKNSAAVARGRAGGLIGGRVRAYKLDKKTRVRIARKGAQARWKRKK
jgi:hypothetical protein